jgi:hypothetical protein
MRIFLTIILITVVFSKAVWEERIEEIEANWSSWNE